MKEKTKQVFDAPWHTFGNNVKDSDNCFLCECDVPLTANRLACLPDL